MIVFDDRVQWWFCEKIGGATCSQGFGMSTWDLLCVEGDADSESAMTMQAAAKGFGKQKLHEMKYFSLGGGHEELVEMEHRPGIYSFM